MFDFDRGEHAGFDWLRGHEFKQRADGIPAIFASAPNHKSLSASRITEAGHLENQNERVERTAKPEVQKTFQIGGQTVEALTVEDREFTAGGKLTEATLDYFAQDDNGNVYYIGEDVNEYKNGKVSGHSGAWLFGRDTQSPGLLMPAHPKVGDKFKSENVPPISREADEVVSVSETVTVPAGTFQNCVEIKEIAGDGDTENKLYAPNTGCIEEIEGAGALPLKSHSTN